LVERQDAEIKEIKTDILKMCWHMRGGVTYEEAMNLGYFEREIIGEIIKGNIETTKESGLPYF